MKKILLFTLIALMGSVVAEAANTNNEKLKDFYGHGVVFLGYQATFNNTFDAQDSLRSYQDKEGKYHSYYRNPLAIHELSVGAKYNVYYSGFSKKIHPFIGAELHFNIPMSNFIEQTKSLKLKQIGQDAEYNSNKDNLKVYTTGTKLYNVLTGQVKAGMRININKTVAVEPYVGYGKTLTLVTSVQENRNYDINPQNGKMQYYTTTIDKNDGKTPKFSSNQNRKFNENKIGTLVYDVYSVGADVLFTIKKQTFSAGLEYKFINSGAAGTDSDMNSALSLRLGYQFM